MFDFSEEQLHRYSRNILLEDVGIEGQQKLLDSKVLIIGAGGLGSPVALYLAAAGVGTVGIADGDLVELSNLQRQVIHFSDDIEKMKVVSVREKIGRLNPDVNVITYEHRLTSENIAEIVREYDFVVDGTDSFSSKFLINDACVLEKIPFSHGGILRFTGQTMTVIPGETTCYRCVFRTSPPEDAVPTCAQAGVLGAVAGMLGTIQAAEALKYLTGTGELITNRMVVFDAKTMNFRSVPVPPQESCPICGTAPTISELIEESAVSCETGSVS